MQTVAAVLAVAVTVIASVAAEEGWHWAESVQQSEPLWTPWNGLFEAAATVGGVDPIEACPSNTPGGSPRELPNPSVCAAVLRHNGKAWQTWSGVVDSLPVTADRTIEYAVQNFRGTERCKAWYLELMCRYTYPGADYSSADVDGTTSTFVRYPLRVECELYRETCPFPLGDCRSFPNNPQCGMRYSRAKMPYNPHKILMPFSPIVFGLLILGSGLYYWYVLSYQRRVQENIRSRQIEYAGAFTAAEQDRLMRDAASRPAVEVDAAAPDHVPDRARADAVPQPRQSL